MTWSSLVQEATSPASREQLARPSDDPSLLIDLRADGGSPAPPLIGPALRTLPRLLVGFDGSGGRPAPGTAAATVDVVVEHKEAACEVHHAAAANPLAAAALALVMRGAEERSIDDGLMAESATYSLLQAGPEHTAWLAARSRRARSPHAEPAVLVERVGGRLVLTLNRPHVRNAFDARMRDELLEGLGVAAADPSITTVVLRGDGPAFCSGGDLDEFGTTPDPATAHLLRLGRSAGRAISAVADRAVATVHGACVGAGVELPAFAGRVVAAPNASFSLPEVGMGLIPGAGGTVSITRRIGRHRTAWMAITGRAVDADRALAWRLVDEIGDGQAELP